MTLKSEAAQWVDTTFPAAGPKARSILIMAYGAGYRAGLRHYGRLREAAREERDSRAESRAAKNLLSD